MAGVYIKGMEMPKNCGECLFFRLESAGNGKYYDYCGAKHNIVWNADNKREDYCPLVPVPNHGRLVEDNAIDYQYLYEKPSEAWELGWNAATRRAQERLHSKTFTIIPADKEEGDAQCSTSPSDTSSSPTNG